MKTINKWRIAVIEELKLIENRLIEIENKLLKRKSKTLSNERNRLIAHRRELESLLIT